MLKMGRSERTRLTNFLTCDNLANEYMEDHIFESYEAIDGHRSYIHNLSSCEIIYGFM